MATNAAAKLGASGLQLVPFEDKGGTWQGPLLPRHCDCARVGGAVGADRDRMLTLADRHVGKTFIAFQLAQAITKHALLILD